MNKYKNYKTYCKSLPAELRECSYIYLHTKKDHIILLSNIDKYWNSLDEESKGLRINADTDKKIESETGNSIQNTYEPISGTDTNIQFDTIIFFTETGNIFGFTIFGELQDLSNIEEVIITFESAIEPTKENDSQVFTFYLDTVNLADVNDITEKDALLDRSYLPKYKLTQQSGELIKDFPEVDSYLKYTDDLSDILADPAYSIITDSGSIGGNENFYSLTFGSNLKYGLFDYNKITVINGKTYLYSLDLENDRGSVLSLDDTSIFNRPKYILYNSKIETKRGGGIDFIAGRYIVYKDHTCWNIEENRIVKNPNFYQYLDPWTSKLFYSIDINKFPIDVSKMEFQRKIGGWYIYKTTDETQRTYYVSLSGVVQVDPEVEIVYPLNDKTLMIESIETIIDQDGEWSNKRILSFYFPSEGEHLYSMGCFKKTDGEFKGRKMQEMGITIRVPSKEDEYKYPIGGTDNAYLQFYGDKVFFESQVDSMLFSGLRHKPLSHKFLNIPGYNKVDDLKWKTDKDYSEGRIIDTFRGYIFYIATDDKGQNLLYYL